MLGMPFRAGTAHIMALRAVWIEYLVQGAPNRGGHQNGPGEVDTAALMKNAVHNELPMPVSPAFIGAGTNTPGSAQDDTRP